MNLPIKYNYKFKLIDIVTRKELGEFKARIVQDKYVTTNGSDRYYSFSIATPINNTINFKSAGSQQVVDLATGVEYVIANVRGLTHEQLGHTYSYKRQTKEVILELM